MKRLTLLLISFTIIASSAVASGNGKIEERINLVSAGNDVFKVFYETSEATSVKIRILDDSGTLIKSDRVNTTRGFMRPYDFSKMDRGNYTVELSDKYGVARKKLVLSDKQPIMMTIKPLEGDKYELNVVNHPNQLILTIYDSNDQAIHKERYASKKEMQRIYDLSTFDSSNFRFELMDKSSVASVSVH